MDAPEPGKSRSALGQLWASVSIYVSLPKTKPFVAQCYKTHRPISSDGSRLRQGALRLERLGVLQEISRPNRRYQHHRIRSPLGPNSEIPPATPVDGRAIVDVRPASDILPLSCGPIASSSARRRRNIDKERSIPCEGRGGLVK